ncbi:MAG: hypothetical protein HY996_05145 [Micrococcales bacterium]|nr:hypothetical protein [Micrococcales bacterium]
MRLTIRRGLLVSAATLVLSPMLVRADDDAYDLADFDQVDPDRLEVGATALGGRTRYTSCGSTYEVNYAGLSAHASGGGHGYPSFHAELGGAMTRDREVADDDGPVGDEPEVWDPTFYTFAQIGEDWEYFGVLVGGGLALLDDPIPLPALTIRIGPRRPVRLDLHLLDWSPLQRGVAGAELAFWPARHVEMGVGVRLHLDAEAPTATFRVDFPIGNQMRIDLLAGASVMANELVGQGEVAVVLAL